MNVANDHSDSQVLRCNYRVVLREKTLDGMRACGSRTIPMYAMEAAASGPRGAFIAGKPTLTNESIILSWDVTQNQSHQKHPPPLALKEEMPNSLYCIIHPRTVQKILWYNAPCGKMHGTILSVNMHTGKSVFSNTAPRS